MKVTGKYSLSALIEFALKGIMVLGIVVILTLPYVLQKYAEWMNPQIEYYPTLAILYASGMPAVVIVHQFIKIFHTLTQDNPFTCENVKHFRVISVCSLIIAIEYVIGIFFITSIFAIVIIGVFAVCWLGTYILAKLLEQAIAYKEENELTI